MLMLLVVGEMDAARAEILGKGNTSLSWVERFSQVFTQALHCQTCMWYL